VNDLRRRLRARASLCTVAEHVAQALLDHRRVRCRRRRDALASALAARGTEPRALPKGDLVVAFSGTGGGSYRFHQPALGGDGSACRVADTTYTEIDTYHWSYRFVLPPGGGSSDTPSTQAGGGQLSGTQPLL
jgi:hypothetical protein